MPSTLAAAKARLVQSSLGTPTTLGRAIARLGFVQADPIRAPARAQDLTLRHRVGAYRAGDLDRRFVRLGIEEDFLYAYGFMPRATLSLLHPRRDRSCAGGIHVPRGLAAEVLAFVRERGTVHPRDLAEAFGTERVVNGWGGLSQATTSALKNLHYYGKLRVAGRRNGVRIYGEAPAYPEAFSPEERMRRVVMLVARILCPISEKSLAGTLHLLTKGAPGLGRLRDAVHALLKSGELEREEIEGCFYLWPAGVKAIKPAETARVVRFLSPFDPLVWDRRRFEHLWGWQYRFEAYTKAPRRRFGYYAMPLLFGNDVIGWVNVSAARGSLACEVGYATRAPKGRAFREAFDAEVARMAEFLSLAQAEK
ncbi:MAG TPA: crosslink repair DNA glycosylase YcaQ family protein [Acetobacteraceae bacterium]|nr:crosslink repair DNA glycosylase YcaQ family protein [Acetobacteraceae bacterium]